MIEFTSDAYERTMYEKILAHANCSAIEIANYADGENVAVECTKCNEVIIDFNRPREGGEDESMEA